MSNEYQKVSFIRDYLAISCADTAQNVDTLVEAGLTAVIRVMNEACPGSDLVMYTGGSCQKDQYFRKLKDNNIEFIKFYQKDDDDVDIIDTALRVHKEIERVRGKGGKVLLHCRLGVSRSVTCGIFHLMSVDSSVDFHTALDEIKKIRPIAKPNQGFVNQLVNFNFSISK